MRKISTILLIAVSGFISKAEAQDYIPLLLDSSYTYETYIDFDGETIIKETNPVKGGKTITIKNTNDAALVEQVFIYNSVGKLVNQSANIHNK